jgi:hypothetical protein
MKRAIVAVLLVVLLAAPADAFSVKTPFVKAKHGLVYVGKKIGDGVVYGMAAFFAVAFCLSTGECQ